RKRTGKGPSGWGVGARGGPRRALRRESPAPQTGTSTVGSRAGEEREGPAPPGDVGRVTGSGEPQANALDAHDHAVVRLLDLEPEHGPVGARRERVPQHILIPDLAVDSAPNARRDGDGRAERLARHRLRLPAALAPDQPAVFEVEDV